MIVRPRRGPVVKPAPNRGAPHRRGALGRRVLPDAYSRRSAAAPPSAIRPSRPRRGALLPGAGRLAVVSVVGVVAAAGVVSTASPTVSATSLAASATPAPAAAAPGVVI